jgi:hypothetical protein
MLVFGGLQERVALVELLVAGLEVVVILGDRDGEGTRSQRGQSNHREHVHLHRESRKPCGPPAKEGGPELGRANSGSIRAA